MKKNRILYGVLICSVVVGMTGCFNDVQSQEDEKLKNNQELFETDTDYDNIQLEIPNEIDEIITNYYSAYKEGVANSVDYTYFPNEIIKNSYVDSNDYLIEYSIVSIDKINDNLYDIVLDTKTMISTIFNPNEFERVYNFIGKIDGTWYHINNVSNIPLEIQENLQTEKYEYENNFIIVPEDVIFE